MMPILILVLSLTTPHGTQLTVEQIPFRTMESCDAAALRLERDLGTYNAVALCIDRSVS